MGDIRILRNILMCCGSLHAMLSLPDICESSILAALVKRRQKEAWFARHMAMRHGGP